MRIFTHIQDERAKMIDISQKPDVIRKAKASGEIYLKSETIDAIKNRKVEKGEVLETARIASVMAVKQTSSIIPMCHNIPITGIDVSYEIKDKFIKVCVEVKTIGKTGVEMEALNGVTTALLTIWDMVKSAEKDETGNYPQTKISNIKVLEKFKMVL